MSRAVILLIVAIGSFGARAAAPVAPVSTNLPPPRVAGSLIELKAEAEMGRHASQKLYADALKSSQNFAAAEFWYRAAAVQGDAPALTALGDLYQGDRGAGTNYVKMNLTNALVLYRLAALQGYKPAHFALFFAYRDGKCTERNLVESYRHLLLSDPSSTREDLARQMVLVMSHEQIREAEKVAKEFKPLNFAKAFEELVFESIRVSGTMGTEADRVAFINGSVVPANGTLRIRVAGLPAVIKCSAIARDYVNIVFNGTERAIPFRRPNSTLVKATPGLTAR